MEELNYDIKHLNNRSLNDFPMAGNPRRKLHKKKKGGKKKGMELGLSQVCFILLNSRDVKKLQSLLRTFIIEMWLEGSIFLLFIRELRAKRMTGQKEITSCHRKTRQYVQRTFPVYTFQLQIP